MLIVPGSRPHAIEMARGVARCSGGRVASHRWRVFPDGERYVRLEEDVRSQRILLVQSMEPPQGEAVLELLLLLDAVSRAESVALLLPYLPYARQDREFLPGEAVSVRALLRALSSLGSSALIVAEAHSEQALSYFPGEVVHLKPLQFLARREVRGEVAVVSPDAGGLERAKQVAEALGAPLWCMEKRRDRHTGEIEVGAAPLDVAGRRVLIVDDVLSTGSTVAKVARALKERGARGVEVMVVHHLGLEGSVERVLEAADGIIASNTLPPRDPRVRYVDITEVLCEGVAEWARGDLNPRPPGYQPGAPPS